MPITNIISLNQIINWFHLFQQNHFFLKDFGFGETYDIGTSRQMTFPYMWVTLNDDNNIATGSNIKSAIPDFSFSIMMMDKINIQENYLNTNGFPSDNSQEILSDTIQYIQDLVTWIQQEWGQYGVMISQDVNFFPVIDETPDKATGMIARIVLRTRQVNCIIPENPFITPTPTTTPTPTPTPTCPTTTQYLEVNYSSCHNFSLTLFNDSGFTSNANAICDYVVSGTAYGDMGTIYTGTETIQYNDHNHNFNLNAVLQPGECVDSFQVHSVDTSQCTCPVIVDFSPYI